MRKNKGINMYVDYSRTYRRRRRGSRKIARAFLVLIIAVLLGYGSYYVIKIQMNLQDSNRSINRKQATGQEQIEEGNIVTDIKEGQEDIQPETAYANDETNKASGDNVIGESDEGAPTAVEETPEVVDTRIPTRVKGLYVTSKAAGTDSIISNLVNITETSEVNALVIDVKDDNGKITYSMDSPLAKSIGSITNAISDMKSLIAELKQKDIYVIARIVAFKDPYLAETKHELAIKNADGTIYRDNKGECWVNPYNREVWDYLIEVSEQAAATGFDEIQFDYIRFSTGSGMDKVDFGEEAKTKSKEDVILEFTKHAYERLKPLGVFVSADVYGTIISSSIDAGLVGQNYVEMSKHLDYICPMIYPSHFGEGNYGVKYPDLEPFKIIRKVLTASKSKLAQIPEGEHRAIVRPWLQDFTASWLKNYMIYGADELRQQIGGVYSVGYSEWLVWNAGCNYSVDGFLKQ